MRGLPADQIAAALGVSEKRIRQRAAEEHWVYWTEKVQGGKRKLYSVGPLPATVREAVLAWMAAAAPDVLPAAANGNRHGAPAVEPAGPVSHLSAAHLSDRLPTVVDRPAPAGLADWQRRRADARAALLAHLDGLVEAVGTERGIRAMVEAAAAGRLPPALQDLVPVANARSGDGATGRTLSRPTLMRWRAELRAGTTALAPKAATPKAVPAWAPALLRLHRRPGKPSLAYVVEQLQRDLGDAAPSYQQARRFLATVAVPEREKGRRGPIALKAVQGFKRRSTDDLWPLDVVLMDGHTPDAEVAHPVHGKAFRPELTAVKDAKTRRVVGWSVALKESTWSVMDAIRAAVERAGVPAILYTDRGSGYVNDIATAAVTGYLGRLGITHRTSLPYNSQARGQIEKLNQDLWIRPARALPGYVGRDQDKEFRRAVVKRTAADLATAGASPALLAWADFLKWAEAQVTAYNARPHRSLPKVRDADGRLRHQTPDEAWAAAEAEGWQPVRLDADAAADLFRPYEVRTTARGEVSLFGARYFAPMLADHHGESVQVGYDIHDPSRVWVRDLDGRLIAVAGLDANKTPFFPKSVVEQARDDRAKRRLATIERNRLEVLAERGPTVAPAAAEPTPRETAALAAIEADLATPAAPALPETPADRWRRATAVLAAGAEADPAQAAWAAVYVKSPEYRSLSVRVADFGEAALDT